METRTDRAPREAQPKSLTEQTFTVVATTTSADLAGQAPNISPTSNLGLVFSPSLPFVPAGASGVEFTCFGLTSGGPWAAGGPEESTDPNVGVSLPSGTYRLRQQNKTPWTTDKLFSVSGDPNAPSVSTPSGPLDCVTVSGGVITGTITIHGDPKTLALTAHGGTLFGVIVGGSGGVEGGQTVGVYGAESQPPAEEEST